MKVLITSTDGIDPTPHIAHMEPEEIIERIVEDGSEWIVRKGGGPLDPSIIMERYNDYRE